MMRGVMPRPDPGSNPGTSVIRVCAVLERADGSPLRKNLGSWPAEEAPAELELLSRDPRFLREVRNRLAEKGFTPEPPLLLDLRQGKHGDAVLFSVGAWPDPDASGACDFAGSRPQVIARASQHG
jgi:hypothetical protein